MEQLRSIFLKELIQQLELIAKLANKSSDAREIESAIKLAREALKNDRSDPRLVNLDLELSTWQSKIAVILQEPIGRQGMSKHCLYWVEKLKKI